jgi:L-threonylcarbamoyladenylate synthase
MTQRNLSELSEIIHHLQSGGIAIAPTATGYALAGNPFDAVAAAKIFALKGRAEKNPLLLLCKDTAQAKSLIEPPDGCQFSGLAYRFWPGSLTIVAPCADSRLQRGVTGEDGTVAVRVDADPRLRELLARLDFPLTGTSANRSGKPAPATASEIQALWPDEAMPALDAGPLSGANPSTIIRLRPAGYELLRAGAVKTDDLDDFFRQACD